MSKDRNIEALYPLSPMQQGMLFHTLYSWESGVYFRQSSWTLRRGLDPALFAQAWREAMHRHPILRTAFVWENVKEPLQVVHREVSFPWREHDWRQLAAAEQQAALADLLAEDRSRPFDLAQAPLMRLVLIRLGEASYHFIWSYPQLLLDGWSRSLLLREVLALYQGLARGEDPGFPASPPFRTYIKWLRERDMSSAEAFWRRKLRGFVWPTTLGVGRDAPPGERVNPSYGEQARWLSREATEALTAMSRSHRLTLNTVTQGAWALLLARYSGDEDVIYGLTLSGRPAELAGVESMVGLFINTLPMRLSVDPAAPVLSLLREIQAQQLELGLYEWTSLLQVQEWSEVVRGEPLFETLFVFENYPMAGPAGTGSSTAALEVEVNHSFEKTNFPLTLVAAPGSQLFLHAAFDDVRFENPTIQRLLDHLARLLAAIAQTPERPISQLSLLGDAERHQLLCEWRGWQDPGSGEGLTHRLLERQAERTPDAVAVETDQGGLTYDQLNRRANRLARLLTEHGAVAGEPVVLLAERGADFLAAVLAAFKAGSAYLPFAPLQPVHRYAQILERSGAPLVLADRGLGPSIAEAIASQPAARRPHLLILEDLLAMERSEENLPFAGTPGDLAYVIYTSGSTGAPKGAMVEHRGMLNHLRAKLLDLEMSSRDVVAQTASQTFDISVWQFLAALLVGGRVRVLGDEVTHDPVLLLDSIEQARVTIFETVPALLRPIVQEAERRGPARSALESLRWVLATGEALPPDLCRDWLALYPEIPLLNAYGPTECSDDVTHHPIHEPTALVGTRAPIGRPVCNLRLHVVDPLLRLMPVKVPGELCVGGIAVGRGYLNDPARTAEVFVPDPFSGRPGARLYRTGDLVRVLESGVIEFRGRLDHQIKIRGFRVELGEIEAVLRQHPRVADAAVIVRSEGADKRLLAYVVPAEAQRLDSPATDDEARQLVPGLRAFLKERLPDYMVPASFALLAALPLNQNGKVDRRSLPEVEWERPELGALHEAARTPVQEILAGIWSEVLSLETIGLSDNFFETGGNSLLAIQVVSRIRKAFGIEIPLRKLFEEPTIGDLSATVEKAMRAGQGPEIPPIRPVARDRDLPLSFAQQRLWFLYQMDSESPVYNISNAVRLGNPVDVALLQASLDEVVRRHESLRTRFEAVEGEPYQRISPPFPLRLPVIDLSALAADDREAAGGRVASALASRPFNLQTGPLLRAALLRLAAQDHVVLVTAHHIISDAWSMRILLREVTTSYEQLAAGQGSTPLPELPLHYADFAYWQRQWLQGETLEAELSYWRQRLSGAPPLLELPTDRPRPEVQTYRGARLPIALPPEVSQGLQALSRREGATLFMTLLAGFQTLLFRYTGQPDLCLGTPVAGRSQLETENLIGVFVNTLVLRGQLAADLKLRAALAQTREAVLEANAHQDMPFEKLVEELQPQRSLRHSPLFQVMLILQNIPQPAGGKEASGLKVSRFGVETGASRFDLVLALTDAAGQILGNLEYSTVLFDASTIQRLRGHLQQLLAGVVADPDQRLADLPLLSPAEREQLIASWNDTGMPLPGESCVHDLIAEQARRSPKAPALVFQEEVISYGELDRRADRLARHLRAQGIGRGDLVGLLVERSPAMVVALLATLKAGAAYVPLDPEYPRERLAFIAADAGLKMLLTQERLTGTLPLTGAPVLRLDADWPRIARRRGGPLPGTAGPADLAYVIYTSGSTGRPKGVEIPHGALVSFLCSMRERPGLTAADRLLAVTSLSFDIAGLELYLPLLVGAAVVLASREETMDGEALKGLLTNSGATVLQATPATWRLLLEAGWEGDPGLAALCGGEGLPEDLAARIRQRSARLWNLYGPTETTIWSTVHEVDGGFRGLALLGRPIGNTQIYLLDPWLGPVPGGAAGELCIGGAGVARGYRGRPDLTAERFVPDPFSGQRGARLYRTGDLARYRSAGELEFLGRMDHQVKVRGFRIELGEIESALREHPGVREAVVVAREDQGERRLVAYFAGSGAGDLRAFLRERLPEFMVPAVFVALPELPLTPNRKVDRRALPAPSAAGQEEAFDAPRTPAEEVIAGIWSEVLKVERVGRQQNFFQLGGHSLLATRIAARVRRSFGLDLPLRRIFEAPTVAELAAAVERAGGRQEPALPLVPVARGGELPLSFAQQRLWFLHQMEPASPAYNIPMAVRLRGPLDPRLLARALAGVVERHEALRSRFPSVDGLASLVLDPPAPAGLPLIDLGGLAVEERRGELRRVADEEARRPFALSAGPPLRALLLRETPEEHALVLTVHHIASDAWSMEVLATEAATLYGAFSRGEESPLPELPIQYADYAVWQRRCLQGEALERELTYWRRQLAGAPPLLALPTDRPRPAVQGFRGGSVPVEVPPDLAAALGKLGREEGSTLFMTLLAAFQVLLARYASVDDLCVGTPVAGRAHLETEKLIGLFANTLVLRASCAGDPSFSVLLARTREAVLEAHAHQQLPFERLVQELQPQRSLGHSPLFQVLFALQNAPREALRAGAIELSSLGTHSDTAKFDLNLTLVERRDRLAGHLEHDADLFDTATAARMLHSFLELSRQMVERPDLPVLGLPMLAPAEREQLLEEWNATALRFPEAACLHEMFERQAERSPAAVAMSCGEEEITYRELDRWADALARELRARGTGPESLVGLCVERSFAMVAAMLGILKAGGGYVPLDPRAPRERLRLLVREADLRLALVPEGLRGRLPDGVETIALDGPPRSAGVGERAASGVTPDNLAYVIYTSGSTGTPKGVMISHRAIANRLLWMQHAFPLTPEDRLLQKTPFTFDASIWEIFVPLFAGARLVLARPDGHQDAAYMIAEIAARQVTVLQLVPSMLRVFVEEEGVERCRSLRRVFSGGEALPVEVQERLFERLAGIELHNLYGPTETAIDAACHSCRPQASEGRAIVPIGRPLSNLRLYALDRWMKPVPVGVAGILYVGGVNLSRGYLDRPDLTAESFVPDPFGHDPGERLYRTGDLVRWLADGTLEFLGRADQQVKIHGFRIEPGEIEAALAAQAAVLEAAVLAREDRPGQHRLAAYVVPRPGQQPTAAELRSALADHLPEYMVPQDFVFLERMPATPSGKLDRKALPAPAAGLERAFTPPGTAVERQLAEIWQELLGLSRVGVHDNFFEVGGDSILAIQVVARANRLGLRLTPRQLFQSPTVAELAAVAGSESTPAMEQGPVEGPVPLTPIQRWFFEELSPEDPHHWHQALLFELRESPPPGVLARAVAALLTHHDALRLRFEPAGETWRQRVAPLESDPPFAWVDLSGLPPQRQSPEIAAAAAQAQTGCDLTLGPLARFVLFGLGETKPGRLLIAVHHLAVDGVSWRVLLEDLQTACQRLGRGEPAALPPKTTSFKSWSERLAAHAGSAAVQGELAYWLAKAASGGPPLPVDFPGGRNDVGSTRGVTVALEAAETRSLLQQVPAVYHTQINDALLTALAAAFRRWTGRSDLWIELEGHGREDLFDGVDLSRTVGWLTTQFPVSLDPGEAPDPGAALKRVKEQLRGIPGRGLGYGLLRFLAGPGGGVERLRAAAPPEVVFNYLGQVDQGLPGSSPLVLAREHPGPSRSPRGRRGHLLEINGEVIGGRLELRFTYSRNLHRRETVEALALGFLAELRGLIEHCLSTEAGGYTPADFPLAGLDQQKLDRLAAVLGSLDEPAEGAP